MWWQGQFGQVNRCSILTCEVSLGCLRCWGKIRNRLE
jgi:hypothetical protein